jgi:hypothetical protein
VSSWSDQLTSHQWIKKPSIKRAASQKDDFIGSSDDSKLSSVVSKRVIKITDHPPSGGNGNGWLSQDRPGANDVRKEFNSRWAQQQAPNDDNNGGSTSTIAYLSKLAERWEKAEMDYYEDSTDYVPSNGIAPSLRHLEKAYAEFVQRFTYENLEGQDEYKDACYGSPYLLVARHVKDTWQVPEAFYKRHGNVRFMLVPGKTKNTSTLFIPCLAGNVHGTLDATISDEIGAWKIVNGLENVVMTSSRGGQVYQPDKSLRPRFPDQRDPEKDLDDNLGRKPHSRLVMEVEHGHRNGHGLRLTGLAAMESNYTRLFLGVRTWPKTTTGDFAAAAVLWGRNKENKLEVRKAFDFGTKPLDLSSKLLFEDQANNNALLPPVLQWTRPRLSPGYSNLRTELASIDDFEPGVHRPINSNWCLVLPAKDLLYKTSWKKSTDEMPYLLDKFSKIPDCNIDLQVYARNADETLDNPSDVIQADKTDP